MLNHQLRQLLLKLARDAIAYGLQTGRTLSVNLRDYPPELTERKASFVTLDKNGNLRGCIGSLEATRPLVEDIAENSRAAAFSDPRFPLVSESELPEIKIHLSILTSPQEIQFSSEADLISQLRPNIDGLILEDRGHRGTFLPSVWESLTEPDQFLKQLKLKAGLPGDYWSDSLRLYRYKTEMFGEEGITA